MSGVTWTVGWLRVTILGYTICSLVNMKWLEEEARALIAHARAHFRKPGVNPYYIRCIVCGRKLVLEKSSS
jgi:hypothetical protein